ncbi:MAG: nucleotidyl transferase AbiEii/AbiGii toxin family protein [Nitrospirae bacterium]|nr:nucleotidyl transferase AbiEii/AbiGii toxin family protein [Nitrospirota bacterium]
MHLETIDESMLSLAKKLDFLQQFSFYLAGGTGLSLQICHRKSFDMDFFTLKEFIPEQLSVNIKAQKIKIEGELRSYNTLHCILEGVKTSFIFYDGLLLFPVKSFYSINVADWRDIIVEKLRTVGDRGQKKDFYDLYYGVQKLGIDAIVELAYKKYGKGINYFHLLKGITYFEDAEKNPEPLLLDKNILWDDVRNFFLVKSNDFENAFKHIYKA